MKAIALLFALMTTGMASAQASAVCKLPLYIQADTPQSMVDSTGNLFLYGLRSAVTGHQGCIVDKMADAHLGLFINMRQLPDEEGGTGSSVIAVALAVPLNGILVYMDHYLLVVRDSDSVDGQVNELLQSIGETLDEKIQAGEPEPPHGRPPMRDD